MEVALSVKPKPSVVVFVSDVRRVSIFYRELASMLVLQEDEGHCVLEVDDFQLVVHRLSGEPSVRQDEAGHVPVREDSYVKLCLPVNSIAAARSLAAAQGGAIRSQQHEWEARGFRACDGHDPEGNVIQVRETAA
jgi:predicted enzyme related to lactoylglutathione lyase